MTDHAGHGYVDCACRDCFDVAVCCDGCDKDHNHHMCSACDLAGCDTDSECSREPEFTCAYCSDDPTGFDADDQPTCGNAETCSAVKA